MSAAAKANAKLASMLRHARNLQVKQDLSGQSGMPKALCTCPLNWKSTCAQSSLTHQQALAGRGLQEGGRWRRRSLVLGAGASLLP